ncbi:MULTISPECIES: hypothetical protein [unclassified Pseudomonas]|uniref:hypothetical protein n=1 Tax=unclassified Pseudomonas TaxID=196821 RepID=UPI002AC8D3F2|nr:MULTISPECIES: hypothetical protein [unclassified Pseudomonas]MEB0044594.1 hypothetical protein [Pseudomonas sp. Dout3]MEB0095792.1 hypothetical protein [Pseudomonas sp. DC1.2]WPX58161.1 hypothetical protein RHM68_21605 [Pseudomonas sp. DC1.2]
MDVRLPITSAALGLMLLINGCSADDEKKPVSLEEKTAQFEKSLDTIADPPLRSAIADLGGSLLLLERAELKLKSKPIETEYGEDAMVLLKHYPTPQALVHTYLNGLFVLRKDSSSDYLTDLSPMFPLSFNMPAQFPFPHGLEWQSVTLSNNKVIPFQPEWSETDPGIQLSPSSSNVDNPDDLTVTYPFIEGLEVPNKSQPQPVMLQGKVEVIAPRRVFTLVLTQQDVGKPRTDDNISVTLLSLGENVAELEVTNTAALIPEVSETPFNPLIVQAKDTTGAFLSRSGSINESAAQVAFYRTQLKEMQQQKAWSDTFEKQLQDEQQAFEQQHPRHYTRVYFNGPVDTVEVNVLDFSQATVIHKDLQLPILRFDPHTTQKNIAPLVLPVVVYDDEAASWLKGATLREEQLQRNVSITQSVDDPSAARIEFGHIKTFNDELLGSSFSPGDIPVTFFTQDDSGKRGEPIELPPEAYQVDPLRGTITYDLNLFAQTPAYAVGSMPLFLATIERKSIDAHSLPKGLKLEGNALVVDLKIFPAQDWRFFAKDDSDNYLKEILSVSHDASAEGPALFGVHYFYGHPTKLETYQRTNLTTVEYGFEIKLDKAEASDPAQ